jgi:protein-S-isoprenylcysteine O-methyltransferase Ste14
MWSLQWLRARRERNESGRIVNPAFRTGALLEFAAFGIVGLLPGAPASDGMQWTGASIALAAAAFGILAGQHLGSQFRVQAVVTDAHRLITSGPYAVVRHPIYASLIGLLAGGALVTGKIVGLAVAMPVFLIGTEIRVRAEDAILRNRFGAEFDRYAARVSAYLPPIR